MALRPIKGEPGKFLDTVSGDVLDISDYREDDKWDTIFAPAGAVVAGTEFIFFRDIQQKRNIDTNFTQVSRLSAGEEVIVDRVGFTVRNATGNLLPTPSDIKKVVENGFLDVRVNRLLLLQGPAIKFPSGYGLSGNTVETGQGIVSVGVPSTAAAARLLKTQLLTSAHEVEATITFQPRPWAVAAGLAQGDSMPTFDTAMFFTVWLHGMIKAAVSK
jgi:hypothetical protein